MRKNFLYFIILLLLTVTVTAFVAHEHSLHGSIALTDAEKQWLAEHPVVRIAPDPDFPPIESRNSKGEFSGIYISFLHLIEERIPLRFEVVSLENWSQVLDQVRNRTIDMTGAACANPDREKYLRFTSPFIEIPAVLVVRDSMQAIPSMKALKGLKVAVVANYADHEYMVSKYPEVRLAVMPDIVSGLREVSFGHVDAMILNLASATYYIEKEGITNLKTSIDSGFVYQLAFPARSDWPQLSSILQKAFDSISPDEKEAAIGRWLGLKSSWHLDRRMVIYTLVVLAFMVFAAVLLWNMTLHRQVAQRTATMEQELQERQKAEQNLLESRKKFYTLFESVNDAVFVYQPTRENGQGNFIEVNSNGCKLLGFSRDELLTMSPHEFVDPEETDRIQSLMAQLRQHQQAVFELTLLNKHGEKIAVEISDRLFELNGQPTVISTVRDIRDRRRTEEELLKIRKLESVGVLAGGIAHDFNNILAAIIGNISVASHILGPHGKVSEILAAAEKASLRARDLTQQLLTFSKGGSPVKETADISEVIRDSADFVLHGSNVACRYGLPEDLWLTSIDRGQISQVIQNMVLNAAHAMPGGGTVSISAENVMISEPVGAGPLSAGQYIRLQIRDTGIGIAPRHISRIFDPYFTTKDKDSRKGSGLGLAIAHSIITQHGGMISVQSQLGKGTVFTVYLPAADKKQQAAPAIMTAPAAGQGRILVMDDEELVRQVAAKMLNHLGYVVECVENGEQAISAYRQALNDGRPYDLLIMDLTIPGGMGGREAVREILAINPEARVIVSSGYANNPVMADFRQYGFQGVVGKPYALATLSQAVHKVLSRQPETDQAG